MIGTMSFDGTPAPYNTGGFVGIGSAVPFVRAEVMLFPDAFNFWFDDLRHRPRWESD